MTVAVPGAFDPLTAPCPFCEAAPGQRCMAVSYWASKPHAARVRLARALAAHADPALDAFFPPLCSCGAPGLPQRHRVVNAIAEHLAAGESAEEVSAEFEVSPGAVQAVQAWAAKWPGAWR